MSETDVAYAERTTGSTPIDVLADSRASQCAIDGPMIKALGANSINVYYTDATQSHDKCMKVFQDNGIYVIANMASQWDSTIFNMTGMDVSSNGANFTWQMDVFKQYAAVLDSMAGYSNLLGLLIGNEIVSGPHMENHVDLAPYLKAAARDMKAYTTARQYRSIPIGYATSAEITYIQELGEYLACGGNSNEAIDFYSVNAYQWCGKSSMSGSPYDDLTAKLEGLAVPIFLSEDGCNTPASQLLRDQSATFQSNMPGIWSGSIVYQWRHEASNYGLVSYTTSGVSTPTTLAGYDALKNQWSAVTANTHPPSTVSSPSCPTSINSYWSINSSAALPTIAGLDFATIKPSGVTGTAHGTRTLTSRSTPSSNPRSKHDIGVMAGIGVGAGVGVVLIFAALVTFFVRRHRRKRARNTGSSVAEMSDTLGAGNPDQSAPLTGISRTAPSADLVHADSPSGLPGSDPRGQELGTVVAHKAGKEEV
ncbi:Glycoside hydrolase superfamily [Penicillium hordei]|uniref:1,3-beta-glucanosyltransferase n=1 Tax=Penicillium hordei TaxID=40994 RepID=A0AAD6E604_9EURO|nr:Glycoside hydrolase superfamily [Penicillium hordei]KAJ5602418.1 Glycoside hydrolase superfamily [Penicillium hordei]